MAETAEDVSNEKLEPKVSLEEGDLQKETISPPCPQREQEDISPEDTPKKTGKSSERSFDHYQAKLGTKVYGGVSSPSWERKASSDSARGSAPLTPGRSQIRSTTQGSETPDMAPSVPKFGEWDESDPASADGYTQIFNIVKEERQGGAGTTRSVRDDKQFQKELNRFGRNPDAKDCRCCWCCCCCPWSGY